METIVVTGKSKGAGKTSLAAILIKNLKYNVGAIKCSLEDGEERMVTDKPEFTLLPGTDTAIFASSGASRVVFLRTNDSKLKEDLYKASALCSAVDYLVIEGNSTLKHIQPSLVVFAERGDVCEKPSARLAREMADLIVDFDVIVNLKEGKKTSNILPFKLNVDEITCKKAHLISRAFSINLSLFNKKILQEGIKVKG